jgi:TrmH family RNA methyltransferase
MERGIFRIEGPQAVREALLHPDRGRVESLYLTDEAADRYPEIAADPLAIRVPAVVIEAMSEAASPQGVIAIARLPRASVHAIDRARLVVIAVDVRDPGNLGTMIRTADAVGADAFIAANSCVDPFSPKVVRSAVGSHWHLPIVSDMEITEAIQWARSAGMRVLAAEGASGTTVDDVDLSGPTAWLLGNEAWGIPADTLAAADAAVGLPIYGQAESLNVAVAAAVLLYASARAQRTTH